MNAPYPNHARHRKSCRMLQPLLLVTVTTCGRSLSHAYSTVHTPNLHHSASSSKTIGAPPRRDAVGNDGIGSDPTGRRAVLRRSAAALTCAATTGIISTTARPARAASNILAPGSPAPEFSLPSSRGDVVTLDSLSAEGRWTVLYFYPGAFTRGCTLEARKFQEDLPSFRRANALVVGVSVDDTEKNAEFCASEGLDFFMLTDEGGKVSKAYGSSLSLPGLGTFSNRQTYIIDPQRNIRWVFVDVESHIPSHSGEVLKKLMELQQQGYVMKAAIER